ncbi:hypothetical protein Ahy_A05g025554 [Arachis hypogaea]|uniref:Uncharacterized protein n=1 Tax=Arachis hypogaea TaxID=3818 RepID=A0A445D903_ARAHY|nr:hypothetical protein Ahy_A05g025554 [Arachis hypogaea]
MTAKCKQSIINIQVLSKSKSQCLLPARRKVSNGDNRGGNTGEHRESELGDDNDMVLPGCGGCDGQNCRCDGQNCRCGGRELQATRLGARVLLLLQNGAIFGGFFPNQKPLKNWQVLPLKANYYFLHEIRKHYQSSSCLSEKDSWLGMRIGVTILVYNHILTIMKNQDYRTGHCCSLHSSPPKLYAFLALVGGHGLHRQLGWGMKRKAGWTVVFGGISNVNNKKDFWLGMGTGVTILVYNHILTILRNQVIQTQINKIQFNHSTKEDQVKLDLEGGRVSISKKPVPSIDPQAEPVSYICRDCGMENTLKPGDVIQCRECNYRILYKKRTLYVMCCSWTPNFSVHENVHFVWMLLIDKLNLREFGGSTEP